MPPLSGELPPRFGLATHAIAICVCILTSTAADPQGSGTTSFSEAVTFPWWHAHLLSSPFGTIDRAIYRLPQPIGTSGQQSQTERDSHQRDRTEQTINRKDQTTIRDVKSDMLARSVSLAGYEPSVANEMFSPSQFCTLRQRCKLQPMHLGGGGAALRKSHPAPLEGQNPAQLDSSSYPPPKMDPPVSNAGYTSALPPFAHSRFCIQYPEDCEVRSTHSGESIIVLTREHWVDLDSINRNVNMSIIPQRNDQGSANEFWLLYPKFGACHDYAITKRHELLSRGYPSGALLLAEVKTTEGEHHLILIVRTNKGEFVLDNLDPLIRPWPNPSYSLVRLESRTNPRFWFKPTQKLASYTVSNE